MAGTLLSSWLGVTLLEIYFQGEFAMSKNRTIAILALTLVVSLIAIIVLATALSDQRSRSEKVESSVNTLIAGQTIEAGSTQTATVVRESTMKAFEAMVTEQYKLALETAMAELTMTESPGHK
jgi:uncharacterized membrane protein YeiB